MTERRRYSRVTLNRMSLRLTYALGLAALCIPALNFGATWIAWRAETVIQGSLLVAVPAVALFLCVTAKRFSLAWSVYWTWSLVFLGLGAAYQMQLGQFPWHGHLSESDIQTAQQIILSAHGVAIVAYFLARRRRNAHDSEWDFRNPHRVRGWMIFALLFHAAITAMFCVIVGPALFSGRADFQDVVVTSHGNIPGFGTMYFLANAGAMILPAMAVTLRKKGLDIPKSLILLSAAVSFVATNPLIGSRFLTGSFLVAIMAALFAPEARRWLPAGIVFAFVTVFPSLDLLRGNGTGSTALAFTPPSQTLVTFDYDAFEMLTRAVSLHGQFGNGITPMELLVAPFLRWVPFLSNGVQGHASGPFVATFTGMTYTNVSMPLWAEAFLIGSWVGLVVAFAALGFLLGHARQSGLFGALVDAPAAAVLFIVLRGSLYEVLGYLLLAVTLAWLFWGLDHDRKKAISDKHRGPQPDEPFIGTPEDSSRSRAST